MANNIKVNFTEEEIAEYIKDLNEAKGNNRKINKLLDLSHLPILVAYLRKIGVNEELLSLAAVVEFTRYKIIDVLTSPGTKEWIVTDKGVGFEKYDKFPHPEMIGVDEKDTFWLGSDKYFGRNLIEIFGEMWPVDSYMYLKNKRYNFREKDRPISRWGFAFCRFHYNGKFSVRDEIIEENGINYFTTRITEVDGSVLENKRIYAGEPINLFETKNTLRENYEMYTTLFPIYKDWIISRFVNSEMDLENAIRRVDSEIYKTNLPKLIEKNTSLKFVIEEELAKYKDNKGKLDDLRGFLDGYECETEEGRNVIESVKTNIDDRLTVDEENVEFILKSCDYDGNNVELENQEYEELRERFEKLSDDIDKLEDLVELLKSVNTHNAELISNIENKIKEIGKDKDDKSVDNKEEEEISL